VAIARARLEDRLRSAWRRVKRLGDTAADHRDAHVAIKRINDRAARRYVPRPYSGRVVLIRSTGSFLGFDSPSFGWSDVVRGELVVNELPIYPRGMLIEPYCHLLADAIHGTGLSQSRLTPAAA
jgi:hypothetical protein